MLFKLIITADDYGMCDSVNHAIESCLSAGAMKATCVMTNMPRYRAAAYLREKYPDASIGLHWNLTQGNPVLPTSKVRTLTRPDGSFYPLPLLRQKILSKRIDRSELLAELVAQYDRFCELAGPPDFWNTHENVHIWPFLFQFMTRVGVELQIPAMRNNSRILVSKRKKPITHNLRHPNYWVKGFIIAFWSARVRQHGVRMPDGLLHLDGYGIGRASLERALSHFPSSVDGKTVECVIHPAISIESRLFGKLTQSRREEYEVFSDAALAKRLASFGVKTASFYDLEKL